MALPKCTVPTQEQWRKLRDESDGKKGLSKIVMGKSLTTFHTAVEKAETSGDLATLNKAIAALKKDATAYMTEVKPKYSELASTVSREILGKLNTYTTAIENMAKQENQKINQQNQQLEQHFKGEIARLKQFAEELHKKAQEVNSKMLELIKQHEDGVRPGEAQGLQKTVQQFGVAIPNFKKAIQGLNQELVNAVTNERKNHPEIVEKLNSTMGEAKKAINDCNVLINTCSGRLVELSEASKKVLAN